MKTYLIANYCELINSVSTMHKVSEKFTIFQSTLRLLNCLVGSNQAGLMSSTDHVILSMVFMEQVVTRLCQYHLHLSAAVVDDEPRLREVRDLSSSAPAVL